MRVPDDVWRAEHRRLAEARAQALSETLARFASPTWPDVIAVGKADEAEQFFEAREAELLRASAAAVAAREVA